MRVFTNYVQYAVTVAIILLLLFSRAIFGLNLRMTCDRFFNRQNFYDLFFFTNNQVVKIIFFVQTYPPFFVIHGIQEYFINGFCEILNNIVAYMQQV